MSQSNVVKLWKRIRMTRIIVWSFIGYEFDWIMFRRYPFRKVQTRQHRAISFGLGYIGWRRKQTR